MINASYPALSGVRAMAQKLGVTANNVANSNTDGFKKGRAVLTETVPSGVEVSAIEKIETSGAILSEEGASETRETSNVSLEEELVDLVATQRAYTADLKAVKAEDELLGKLFDVLA
ncbi:MAG: flagellar basal body rod C-terminal domain-containing protein [Pseudomonadota bacterium]